MSQESDDVERCDARQAKERLQRAGFEYRKTHEDFDFPSNSCPSRRPYHHDADFGTNSRARSGCGVLQYAWSHPITTQS